LFVERIVNENFERKKKCSDLEIEDFVDLLLSLFKDEYMEIKITQDHVKKFMVDLLGATTDTSGATLEWEMLEMLRNP
ncbi:hypothetical protein SUGI_0688020, partial [Cryptomeria japonica]